MWKTMSDVVRGARAKVAAAGAALVVSSSALASGPADIGDLAEMVDFGDVAPGIIGVAGALITLYVIIKGVRIVIGFVRGG